MATAKQLAWRKKFVAMARAHKFKHKRKKNPSVYGNIRRVVLRGDKFKVARALADAHIPFAFVEQAGVNTVGDIGKQHLAKLSKFLGEHPSFEGRLAGHKDQVAANKRKKNPLKYKCRFCAAIAPAHSLYCPKCGKQNAMRAYRRKKNPSGVRIVHNKLLGGWFIVRGLHQTPIGGRFNSKAEAQAHLQRKVRIMKKSRRKNPIKGPGKFEGGTYAGRYAYDNVDEELGDVQGFGWYGNFSGEIKGRGPFHIIVREDSQGFVYGEFFDTEKAMRKNWARLESEYEKFENENAEREGED